MQCWIGILYTVHVYNGKMVFFNMFVVLRQSFCSKYFTVYSINSKDLKSVGCSECSAT